MIKDMNHMKSPKYEAGARSGPDGCKNCHSEIYSQWKNKSRHAIAKTSESYLTFLHKFKNNFMLNTMMGSAMCGSCHGPNKNGVDCETCHGTLAPGQDVMQVHKEKFAANKSDVKSKLFCAKCHSIKNPMSGDYMVNTYNDWLNSPAAKENKTCQSCHMRKSNKPGNNHLPVRSNTNEGRKRLAYHGFNSAVRNKSNKNLYKNTIRVSNIQISSSKITLQINNLVSGHFVPAGGPTRVLTLKLEYLNKKGNTLFTDTKKFQRSFSLMANLMPYKLLSDTRLKPSESRTLTFLPERVIMNDAVKIRISVNLYEVSDEHKGEVKKAHWKSSDIIHIIQEIQK